MTVVRLIISICIVVVLKISHSHAKIDPNNYFFDKGSGLKRLRIDPKTLSSEDVEEVRALTSTIDGHEKYCKFSEIGAHYPWYMMTLGPEKWCFDERDHDICCDGEGACKCIYKDKYQCSCGN